MSFEYNDLKYFSEYIWDEKFSNNNGGIRISN